MLPIMLAVVAFALLPLLPAGDDTPVLTEWVNDFAGILGRSAKADLSAKLLNLEKTDSTQVVVLVVRSTGDRTIEQFALETATNNKIGQAGKDNGILITVAVEDRKCRIEVGYGLEGRIPDGLAGEIIRKEMVPHFKEGDYAEGILRGTEAVIGAVRGEYTLDVPANNPLSTFAGWFLILAFLPTGLSLYLLEKKRSGIGCAIQLVTLLIGASIFSDPLTVEDVLGGFFTVGFAIFLINLVCMVLLSILGIVKLPKGGKGGGGWRSGSSSSGSYGSSSSSGSSFSGGGGSFGGGGAGGSW